MKVFELFNRVTFIDLVPGLVKNNPKCRQYLDAFREAFDILRKTKPLDNCETVSVELKSDGYDGKVLKVINCESDCWEKNLGKDIVLGKGVTIPDAELAASILSSLTFYGINLKERDNFCENLSLCHFLNDCADIFTKSN